MNKAEFLEHLSAAAKNPAINRPRLVGPFRSLRLGDAYCPITAVAAHLGRGVYDTREYDQAAAAIDLDMSLHYADVVCAADREREHPSAIGFLRAELLKAVGL